MENIVNFLKTVLSPVPIRASNIFSEAHLADLDDPVRAVYILYAGDEVLYVGQSGDLRVRLRYHRKDKTFDRVEFYLVPDPEERLRLEGVMILCLRPILNRGLNLGLTPTKCWELPYTWGRGHAGPARPKRRRDPAKAKARKPKKAKTRKSAE